MAQLTGTLILAYARIDAQDTSTVNPGVTDAQGLILLNGILTAWFRNQESRASYLSATASGLTVNANSQTATSSATSIAQVAEAYQATAVGTTQPTTPPLKLISPDEMRAKYNDADGAFTGSSGSWTHFAWEFEKDTAKVIAYVYPVLNTNAYLLTKCVLHQQLAALGNTPDLSEVDGFYISKFLGAKIAKLCDRDDSFIQSILSEIPKEIKDRLPDSAFWNLSAKDRVVDGPDN